jgi:hypothetical protein
LELNPAKEEEKK